MEMGFLHQVTTAAREVTTCGLGLCHEIQQIRDRNAIDPAKSISIACLLAAIARMTQKPSGDTQPAATHECPAVVLDGCTRLTGAIDAYMNFAALVPVDKIEIKILLDDAMVHFLETLLHDVRVVHLPSPKRACNAYHQPI